MELEQNSEGYWVIGAGEYEGLILRGVHSTTSCDGRGCAVHNHPTLHPLFDSPIRWSDEETSIQRMCRHRKWHTDFDEIKYYERIGREHGCLDNCDKCCKEWDYA